MTEPRNSKARRPDGPLSNDPAATQSFRREPVPGSPDAAGPAFAAALRVRCPHCHNPIELVDDAPLAEIVCPACGSSFGLAGDAALTHESQGGTLHRRTVFGHFELLEQLGAGAFGTVWKARDTHLDRIVALKIPRRGHLTSDEAEKFVREARAAAQVRHPQIVSVHEVGLQDDTLFIVSDYIDGLSLEDQLSARRYTAREAVELCVPVAQAMHHAHEQGVIHRDLKPSNILLDAAGRPYIADFGLARREAGEITMTLDGSVLGTPAYMSPEQARGQSHAADRRADVYSLGVILFRLLTGELPFRGNSRMLLKQVLEDDPPSPRRLNHAVPPDLETICLKCLEKDPARRYATAHALADELERFQRGEPILARPISAPQRLWRWCQRQPVVASLTAAVAVVLIAGIGVSSYYAIAADRRATEARDNLLRAQTAEGDAKSEAARATGAETDAKREAQRARDEATRATKAEADSEAERDRARQETEAAEQSLYFNRIALAKRYLDEGDLDRVNALLKLCPERLRHWEYHWLAWVARDQTRLLPHDANLRDAVYSRDGTQIASADVSGTVKLWDAKTYRNTLTFRTHQKDIVGIDFSPDGKRLVTASVDGVAKVWDSHDGSELLTLTGHEGPLARPVAFSPDGQWIATNGTDKALRIWDASAPGKLVKTIDTSQAPIVDFVWHSDSQHVLVLRPNGVWRLDSATGETIRLIPVGGNLRAIDCDASGDHVAIAQQGSASVWDVAGDPPKQVFHARRALEFLDVALSPDSTLVALTSHGTGTYIFDVATGKPLYRQSTEDAAVRLRPDAAEYLITAGWRKDVAVCPTRVHLANWQCGSQNDRDLSFSSDGRWVTSEGGVYSVYAGTPLFKPGGVLSPNGQHLATRSSGRNQAGLVVRNAESFREVRRFEPLPSFPERVVFSPDGKLLAASSSAPSIWKIKDAESVLQRDLKGPEFRRMAFSPDSRVIAYGGFGGEVCVRDLSTGELIRQWRAHTDSLSALAFSRSGKYLATGGHQEDRKVKLWGTSTWNLQHAFPGHEGIVKCLAFSRDERRLVSSGHDGTLRVWNPATGAEVIAVRVSDGVIESVAFAPDDRSLATAGNDGILRMVGDVRPRVKPGVSIDLLKLVDPSLDALDAEVESRAGALTMKAGHPAGRIRLPVWPLGSYELSGSLSFPGNGTPVLIIPTRTSRGTIQWRWSDQNPKETYSALERIDGKTVIEVENPTRVSPSKVQAGRQHAFRVRVVCEEGHADIAIELDGAPYIHWKGPESALSIWSGFDLPHHGIFGLAMCRGQVTYHDLTLKMLDGEAVLLRMPPTMLEPPPGAKAVPTGETVDLLKLYDPQHDAFDITAQTTDAGLELAATDKPGRLGLPVWPHGSYELTGSFTLSDNGVPTLLVPTTRSRGLAVMHCRRDKVDCAGFGCIRGLPLEQPTTPGRVSPSKVQVGKRHAFRIQVHCQADEADVAVELDGAPYFSWKGPESDLGIGWPGWDIPHQRTIGLGIKNGRVTFHDLTLKMLDGEAWLLRP